MSTDQSAAPGTEPEIPAFKQLATDPEIAPLLAFQPVVRKVKRPDGWTPELQRELIARIASTGTVQAAVWQMGKHATGAEGLYKTPGATSFRISWDAAIIIGRRRNGLDSQPPFTGEVPGIQRRGKWRVPEAAPPLDPAAILQKMADTRDRITERLLHARRLFLADISDCPGKRAAFEILTELPIDWEKAERAEPQPDEPYRKLNVRDPDLLLTGENGWLGDMAHGPDKKEELRRALDQHRAEQGLPAIDWGESTED